MATRTRTYRGDRYWEREQPVEAVDGGDPERVVQAIEANVRRVARALADDVALEIGRVLVQVTGNMPRTALA